MTVTITAPRETRANEKRVAVVPAVAPKLEKLGTEIRIQKGAGEAARIPDEAYENAGIHVGKLELGKADIVLSVQAPSPSEIRKMKKGSILLSFVYAHRDPKVVEALVEQEVTCFAMDRVPRITRAQAMDALSTQAALAGYYGGLLAATNLHRILPMMTTAVGSIRPAKVLVIGAGVAGLQAIATARRLGAMVEGYDVRSEAAEQVESLGAKFVDTGVSATGEGGYARELTDEEKARAAEVVTRHVQNADAVITTANIPGQESPKVLSEEQIRGMKPGAVIVDLAADGGGNTPLTQPGETVEEGSVTIVAPLNVPSLLAEHASELYAKNLLNFLGLIVADGEIQLNWEDEVIARSCLTHAGEIRDEVAAEAVRGD
ncbi:MULTISPECIES: NAD(P) transhydrogenase subunit alpha [Halomonadaceae]|uniref:proton-translocating NAD(P)(+) transhydrogenase n=1 Tax=Vreelandella halophila TaxID=86177 RepID=A0A9X4YDQ0_9GAMM|nr:MULTISPECIES: NAD(P) transhydrogenase subunit alpha [Halomonas]MYL27270.1 NAD(P)(+) transhydrogenase (Re/Si-specific) subunit alpha [Halomonas utahensis]MYL74472.1 NAD(P)(+) transhydrogenase (Re/Si-specific) subunit alpha [Halomonas sp. 22501_18_FS]